LEGGRGTYIPETTLKCLWDKQEEETLGKNLIEGEKNKSIHRGVVRGGGQIKKKGNLNAPISAVSRKNDRSEEKGGGGGEKEANKG